MKCSCANCGGHIEYDAASAGLEITCPHCKGVTRLAAYSAGPPPIASAIATPPRKKGSGWVVLLVIGGLAVVMIPVIGLLAAIAIPNFIKAREASQRSACVANLRMIHGAKETWAVEFKKKSGDRPTDTDLFGPGLYLKEKPACPAGGEYNLNDVEAKATCSIPGHEL
jgi:competence protein ComGC